MIFNLSFTPRSVPAISIPFIAPSTKLRLEVPLSDFFRAPTVLPLEVMSIFKVPLPLSMSLWMASTMNGPTAILFMFCFKARIGVLRASTLSEPLIVPSYRLAENGANSAMPSLAFSLICTLFVLILATLSWPIFKPPSAFNFFKPLRSIGFSLLLFVSILFSALVMYLSASNWSISMSK